MDRVKVGKFVKTVGLRGDIKVYPYSTDTSIEKGVSIYVGSRSYVVERIQMRKNNPVLHLEGIDHIDDAEVLLHQELEMERDDISLDEDEYLVDDLIGLAVYEEDEYLGDITDIKLLPGQDLYVVGEDLLIPAVEAFIKEIDLEEKRIRVELIEGMR